TSSRGVGNYLRSKMSQVALWVLRILEMAGTCTAFSLLVHKGGWGEHNYGHFCMAVWCICFILSTIVMIVEISRLYKKLPFSWSDLTITISTCCCIMLLLVSILYPVFSLNGTQVTGEVKGFRIGTTVASCLTTLVYAAEVGVARHTADEMNGFMSTIPGILKIVEAFIAILIFLVVDDKDVYNTTPAKEWSMAVYCLCFIGSFLAIVVAIVKWPIHRFDPPVDKIMLGFAAFAVVAYASAVFLWPIYSFDGAFQIAQNSRPTNCPTEWGECEYDDNVSVTVATCFNFIVYLIDLILITKKVLKR
uniref:Zgc:77748 n=2 Tax=Petromyzon marinus TaxID=7757 RepID=S4S1S7_PETMA